MRGAEGALGIGKADREELSDGKEEQDQQEQQERQNRPGPNALLSFPTVNGLNRIGGHGHGMLRVVSRVKSTASAADQPTRTRRPRSIRGPPASVRLLPDTTSPE